MSVRAIAIALMLTIWATAGCQNQHGTSPSNASANSLENRAAVEYARNLPGSSGRDCVSVNAATDARSGGFIAGNFELYREQWSPASAAQGYGKIYWIPLTINPGPQLRVTVKLLTGSRPALSWSFATMASGSHGPFFPTTVPLPTRGLWRIEGAAGPSRGCFLLRL